MCYIYKSQDGGYSWSITYLCILQFKKMLNVRRRDYSLQCYWQSQNIRSNLNAHTQGTGWITTGTSHIPTISVGGGFLFSIPSPAFTICRLVDLQYLKWTQSNSETYSFPHSFLIAVCCYKNDRGSCLC